MSSLHVGCWHLMSTDRETEKWVSSDEGNMQSVGREGKQYSWSIATGAYRLGLAWCSWYNVDWVEPCFCGHDNIVILQAETREAALAKQLMETMDHHQQLEQEVHQFLGTRDWDCLAIYRSWHKRLRSRDWNHIRLCCWYSYHVMESLSTAVQSTIEKTKEECAVAHSQVYHLSETLSRTKACILIHAMTSS